MRLDQLISDGSATLRRGEETTDISAVTEDSRQVTPGALFVARRGTRDDGRRYLRDAAERGAAAVLLDADTPEGDWPAGPAVLAARDTAVVGGRLAERLEGDPSRRLALVGVTGTNGKTTITCLIQQLLRRGGMPCGLIGTVRIDDGTGSRPASLTTPGGPETSRLLGTMVRRGCRACAMEVSSHALDQHRVDALRFAVGVFTNLTGDHLDYHGTMERYADAKARLFAALDAGAAAVVNADDPWAARMIRDCRAPVLRTSLIDPAADCFAAVGRPSVRGTPVRLRGPWGEIALELPLIGRHNVANALQAAAVAHALGLGTDALAASLATVSPPPGRLERVPDPRGEVSVFVDYAHTDDALANLLASVRPLVPEQGALTVVFGCGGDRDRTKRPRMAGVAARFGDRLVVTSDNPRTESPEAIVNDILAGLDDDARRRTVPLVDRAAAIRTAILEAKPGGVVVIAGKGHEDYQIVGTEKRPFDDRLVAAEAIAQRGRA